MTKISGSEYNFFNPLNSSLNGILGPTVGIDMLLLILACENEHAGVIRYRSKTAINNGGSLRIPVGNPISYLFL